MTSTKLPPAKVQAHADTNGVSPADLDAIALKIARQVSRNVDDNETRANATKQVSVPVRFSTLAQVEVLAARSGVSRGVMLAQLAAIGAMQVTRQLDASATAEVGAEVMQREQELHDEFDLMSA